MSIESNVTETRCPHEGGHPLSGGRWLDRTQCRRQVASGSTFYVNVTASQIGDHMKISAAHSFLVHASKHLDPPPAARGTAVPMEGQLFNMLQDLCDRAPKECRIEIVFRPNEDGTPDNDSRARLERYLIKPSLDNGRVIAEHLQIVTTKRSGLGLLFLAKCEARAGAHGLLISRFPAEQGVVAQEHADRLDVEFIERVFMKNAKAYKSAVYETKTRSAGLQEGRAIDRQLSGPREISQYWIGEFLASELRTTGPFGSRRLADALRTAVNGTESHPLKQELVSAARLLRNQHGRVRSARAFLSRIGMSEDGMAAVERAFVRPELMDQSFRFDAGEFGQHISYRMVELDTGAILMAEDTRFDDVFRSETVVAENTVRHRDLVRYSTEGEVVDQRYRKRK